MILNEQRFLNTLRQLTNSAKVILDDALLEDSEIDSFASFKISNALAAMQALLDVVQVESWTVIAEETIPVDDDYRYPNEHDPNQNTEDFINDEELMASRSSSQIDLNETIISPPFESTETVVEDPIIGGIFTGEFDELGAPILRYEE